MFVCYSIAIAQYPGLQKQNSTGHKWYGIRACNTNANGRFSNRDNIDNRYSHVRNRVQFVANPSLLSACVRQLLRVIVRT